MDDVHPGLVVTLRQDAPIPLDVAFSVAAGEIVALVGPSGSGKTTTLRAIAGLHRPKAGHIACGGQVWFDDARRIDVPVGRRRVGLVFQSYALFPHLSAIENVMEAMGDTAASVRRAQAAAFLDRVHLGGLADRKPAHLSGGQQQRVAVARALARNPAVLLLDEPFSAVDRMTRHRLQRELAELRLGLAMPIILVTHDLEEAARLADRIAVLHRGRLLQIDTVEAVTARPASPMVARLVGIRNIFAGQLRPGPAGRAVLDWNERSLETAIDNAVVARAAVAWCLAPDGVVVHRKDRPSRGEQENPVSGTVREAIALGAMCELTIDIAGPETLPLHVAVPIHVARRNGIETGAAVTVSLRAQSIHVMSAPDEIDQTRAN